MERTKGGLNADPRGTPASSAPFPELASESVAISWAEVDPTKVFGAENESMVSLYGPRRRKSPKVSSVKEWWRMGQEGGEVEPMPGVEGS